MEFEHKGKIIRLQGVTDPINIVELQDISVEKVEKWHSNPKSQPICISSSACEEKKMVHGDSV